MKEKTKEMADQVGAVYPTLLLGRHDGVLFTETELETFVELVAAAELRRLHEVNQELLISLLKVARMAEALKKDCGMDPEAPQAYRNGEYMNISYAARAAITKAEGEQA